MPRAPMEGLNFHFCHFGMSLKLKSANKENVLRKLKMHKNQIVKNNEWCPAKIFAQLTGGEWWHYKESIKLCRSHDILRCADM